LRPVDRHRHDPWWPPERCAHLDRGRPCL